MGGLSLVIRGIHSHTPAISWKDGMVSGNGLLGVIVYGNPLQDTYIYQNTKFNVPNSGVREAPDISGVLKEVRDLTLAGDGKSAALTSSAAATTWLKEYTGDDQASWDIVWTYTFHPGYQAHIDIPASGLITQYDRWTNYETGEIGVQWHDNRGNWLRKTFVSRVDNVIMTVMEKPTEAAAFNASIRIDVESLPNFARSQMAVDRVIAEDGDYLALKGKYASYPNSPLRNGGYAGVTKIVTDGKKIVINETVHIVEATQLILLTVLDRQEGHFQLEDSAILNELLNELDAVVKKYTFDGRFDYSSVLIPHAQIHGEMMNRVTLQLDSDPNERSLTSEQLISLQNSNPTQLNKAFVEKMFDSGRYVYISSSGYNPPRLMGLWTGEFMPEWSGDFTTDANLNLQIAGGNIGNTPEAVESYIDLIMRHMDDWELNAERIFGIPNAILAPPRTDGDGAALTHFTINDDFPGHYWISGASWMLLPIYEYYLTYGNQLVPNGKGQKELVLPMLYRTLTKLGNFYEGFLNEDYVDSQGKYLFVPSYSPENVPANRHSSLQPNATMDIASARHALLMLLNVSRGVDAAGDSEKWEQLLNCLPDYMYNSDDSLKEWAMEGIDDHHYHRHISHLYPAWPSLELNETGDTALHRGIIRALDNRIQNGTESAVHGLVHKGLVEARVNRGEGVYQSLLPLFTESYIFSGLMMSHNDHFASLYCTDGPITIPAVLMEAFVYSDAASITFLPALPAQFTRGEVKGLRARNQTTIHSLQWDLTKGSLHVALCSDIHQQLQISNRLGIGEIQVSGASAAEVADKTNARSLTLLANQATTITITWPIYK
ncbi:glycoside hydrolase N-terminal domain-containing protein [Paenibacillus oryzisoli]|uniref:glycosyl hydrolase family 95 catalytic domain-containing protein n=1 Tax=Paenibacillus oryzisoli TaxID=1850517 RepID=UPI003D2E8FCF